MARFRMLKAAADTVCLAAIPILICSTLIYRSEALALRSHVALLEQRTRRLAEEGHDSRGDEPVHPLLRRALGLDVAALKRIQDSLVQQMNAQQHLRWERVLQGPLKAHYKSAAQDFYVRLHGLLFEINLLPLATWGDRDFKDQANDIPNHAWLPEAMTAGRGIGGNLPRLGLNVFLLNHSKRHQSRHHRHLPSNATCLGVDNPAYLKLFPDCGTRLWSLKYQPDQAWSPRPPRFDYAHKWLSLDLMSLTSPESAGAASAMFDLIVIQETFEHIRYPFAAAKGLYHLLKPGGLVLWTAPFTTRYHLIPGDYFRYTFDGARQLFVAAGFKIVGLHKFGDSAMATGNDLGFGSGDFTIEHIKASLVQNIVYEGMGYEDGGAAWVSSNREALYMSAALAARRPLRDFTVEESRSHIGGALSMTRPPRHTAGRVTSG